MNEEGSDVLNAIERWYMEQCNGDWEHQYGVKIDTLDNPGWWVVIDLAETEWADLVLAGTGVSRSELDWFHYEVRDAKFIGSGGLGKLEQILATFLAVIGRPVRAGGDDHGGGPTGGAEDPGADGRALAAAGPGGSVAGALDEAAEGARVPRAAGGSHSEQG